MFSATLTLPVTVSRLPRERVPRDVFSATLTLPVTVSRLPRERVPRHVSRRR